MPRKSSRAVGGASAELLRSSSAFPTSRGALLLACVGVFLFFTFFYAGGAAAAAVYRLVTEGGVLVVWLLAAAGAGAWFLPVFGVRGRRGAFVTATGLGIGVLSLVVLGLGLAGALNRVTAWGLIVAGVAAGSAYVSGDPRVSLSGLGDVVRGRVESWIWLWVAAVPFLAMAVAGAMMPPGVLWGDEPNGYDVVEYHLQVPREWFEAGRIVPLRHNVFSYMPFNVEAHYLLAMHLRGGPWAGMYLAQFMHVAMVALAVLAVAQFSVTGGVAGAVLAAGTPWLTLLAPVAYNEGGVLLFGTLAMGWTLRAANAHLAGSLASRVQEPDALQGVAPPMALAGLFTGFACGAKLTAVPMLLVAVPMALGAAWLVARQPVGPLIKALGVFVVAALVSFSPWLIRNVVWARNPVFPEAMSVLGHAHFTAEQVERWRLAYVPPVGERGAAARLASAWAQIFGDRRYGGWVFVAGAAAFLCGVFRSAVKPLTPGPSPGRGECGERWAATFVVSLLVLWLAFWLTATHLQSRFYVLAIPAVGLLVGAVEWRPGWRLGFVIAAGVQVAVGFSVMQRPMTERVERYVAALGIDSLMPLLQENVGEAVKAGKRVCLVGDARAFLYDVPMSRLHYRTVFDVDFGGRDPINAWSEGCRRQPGDVEVVALSELRRFARTYYGVPASQAKGEGTAVFLEN